MQVTIGSTEKMPWAYETLVNVKDDDGKNFDLRLIFDASPSEEQIERAAIDRVNCLNALSDQIEEKIIAEDGEPI